jgi:integrase/recombinase XerC
MTTRTPPVENETPSGTAGHALALFLAERDNAATRRAYSTDLKDFFGGEPQPDQVAEFLALPPSMLVLRLFEYKADLLARGASEATVNRRLSVLRSLLKFAHGMGLSTCDGRGLIEGERLPRVRDRELLDARTLKRLLATPGRTTLRGLRDSAILRLLCENALRRSELCALNVADFSPDDRSLRLPVGAAAAETDEVPLSRSTVGALTAYVAAAGHAATPAAPLFRNLDHRPEVSGERLTPDGLHFLVRRYGQAVGLDSLTPRQLRESAVAAALAGEFGDLRRVLSQRSALSRQLSLSGARRSTSDE